MRHFITSQIEITATPEAIWNAIIDFNDYTNWNPFINSISGDLKLNGKLNVKIGKMRFKPTIQALKVQQELCWLGKLGLPGIFDGRHRFQLVENGNGTTTFIQSEQFSGILVPFLRKKLNREILPGFEAMNRVLKEKLEAFVE